MEQCFVIDFSTLGILANCDNKSIVNNNTVQALSHEPVKIPTSFELPPMNTPGDVRKALSCFVRQSKDGNIKKEEQRGLFLKIYRTAKTHGIDVPGEVVEYFTRS